MKNLLPFVPVDIAAERLVLGWWMAHSACSHPKCWCKSTPQAMTHALDARLYGSPCLRHIAKALWSIDAAGEAFSVEAYEAALTLDGRWEAVGKWTMWSKLIAATDEAQPFEVEAATERLLRLMERREAVEKLVNLACESDDWASEVLRFVRQRDEALQRGASGAEWKP